MCLIVHGLYWGNGSADFSASIGNHDLHCKICKLVKFEGHCCKDSYNRCTPHTPDREACIESLRGNGFIRSFASLETHLNPLHSLFTHIFLTNSIHVAPCCPSPDNTHFGLSLLAFLLPSRPAKSPLPLFAPQPSRLPPEPTTHSHKRLSFYAVGRANKQPAAQIFNSFLAQPARPVLSWQLQLLPSHQQGLPPPFLQAQLNCSRPGFRENPPDCSVPVPRGTLPSSTRS